MKNYEPIDYFSAFLTVAVGMSFVALAGFILKMILSV